MSEAFKRIKEALATRDLAHIESVMLKEVQIAKEKAEVSIAKAEESGNLDALDFADLIMISNELASMYRGMGRFAESLQNFDIARDGMEKQYGTQNVHYALLLINTAGVYRFMGQFDDAFALYERSANILEEIGKRDSKEYATYLNNISLTYADAGEPDKAIEYALMGLETIQTIGTTDSEIAISLVNIASMQLNAGKLYDAEVNAREALSIYDTLGKSSGHYAAVLNTLATIEYKKGNLNEALVLFTKAAEQTRADFGENQDYQKAIKSIDRVKAELGAMPPEKR